METALADLTLKQAKLKLNSLVREAENLDYLSHAELDFMLALVRHIQKLGGGHCYLMISQEVSCPASNIILHHCRLLSEYGMKWLGESGLKMISICILGF